MAFSLLTTHYSLLCLSTVAIPKQVYYFQYMKPIFLFLMAVCLLSGTNLSAQAESPQKTRAVQAINIWPFSMNGETNDTLVYVFRNDTVLLRTSYTNNHVFFQADKDEADSAIVRKHYRYFLFKKGAATGKWFEDYQLSSGRFNETDLVDSVLQQRQGYFSTPLSVLLDQDSVRLISSRREGQTTERTYVLNETRHIKGADTLVLGFNPAFRQPGFRFYDYTPAEEQEVLYSVRMIAQCDEAVQKNMPEFALIIIHHYLAEVDPAVLKEAEKYFSLFQHSTALTTVQKGEQRY